MGIISVVNCHVPLGATSEVNVLRWLKYAQIARVTPLHVLARTEFRYVYLMHACMTEMWDSCWLQAQPD